MGAISVRRERERETTVYEPGFGQTVRLGGGSEFCADGGGRDRHQVTSLDLGSPCELLVGASSMMVKMDSDLLNLSLPNQFLCGGLITCGSDLCTEGNDGLELLEEVYVPPTPQSQVNI